MKNKLRKIKGKKRPEVVEEAPYKPEFYFNDKQLKGLKKGEIGKKLNITIQGKLRRISQESDKKGTRTSYTMEIDKMGLPTSPYKKTAVE